MAFVSDHAVLLDRLDQAVCLAPRPAGDLFAKIIAGACTRVPVLAQAGGATKIGRLVESGTWLDAVLALVDLELPEWHLRRLCCEDATWFCSLSRQPNLPLAPDDAADGTHELMALAVLRAFLHARRIAIADWRPSASVPDVESAQPELVYCENFA
jgi:hypothetical protein